MKASGLGRALRYFIRYAELYVLYLAVGSFVMAAYICLMNGMDFHLRAILLTVPRMEICLSVIFIFTSGICTWNYAYYIPISFGCRRWNAFLGILSMDAVLIAECLVLYKLMEAKFNPGGILFDLFETPVLLAVFIFTEAVSRLIGAIASKFGKLAYLILIIVSTMAITVFIIWIVFSTTAKWGFLGSRISGNGKLAWQWILLLASTALSVVAHAVNWHMLYRYEVRP